MISSNSSSSSSSSSNITTIIITFIIIKGPSRTCRWRPSGPGGGPVRYLRRLSVFHRSSMSTWEIHVGSHNSNSHLRVSNPRASAYSNLELPFESSKLPSRLLQAPLQGAAAAQGLHNDDTDNNTDNNNNNTNDDNNDNNSNSNSNSSNNTNNNNVNDND